MTPRPFRIGVPDAVLEDLNHRLRATRWPDSIDPTDWLSGTSLDYMRELVQYWQRGFRWREQERSLNEHPQFLANINGHVIHFLHRQGNGPRPLPIVLTHGWPGSFVEMLKLIPLLTDPPDPLDAFDVVVPSVPGFGFSERPAAPGMSPRTVATLWAELMVQLGYERFATQGGDFGAAVSTWLGLLHESRLIGIHLNYIPGSYQPHITAADPPLTPDEKAFLDARSEWVRVEGAYSHLHATKPQTPAFALNDSPAGLAAWIVEKFRGWSDCGGNVEQRFTKDELLTNITIYWVTQTIHSSMRLYYESSRAPLTFASDARVRVPCAVARFPLEMPSPPREWVERGFHVERWTEMAAGGHFAAMEEPELLAADIRAFFRPLRSLGTGG